MAMNHLKNMMESIEGSSNQVMVDPDLCKRAMIPLQRMLDFREQQLSAVN
jgi:quinolinate synthase